MSLDFCFNGHLTELSDLCPGLASNTLIQELSITYKGRSSKTNFLPLNNLLQTNAPCLKSFFLDLNDFGTDIDYRDILPGLRNNRTLRYIRLDILGITDATASDLVSAVARNPNLECLCIRSTRNTTFGDLSSEAFKRLLSDSTSLRELVLGDHDSNPTLNAECFVQGLKKSRSLKRLDIRNLLYGDTIFARLFRILPDCPSRTACA